MSVDNLLIKRLSYLEKIDIETEKAAKKFKMAVPNISGWEIGKDYKSLMLENFDYNSYADYDPIDYVYSYNLTQNKREVIIKRFGGNEYSALLLTNNNTVSLINLVNFIARFCPTNIGLILPCYFTLPNLLNDRNLKFDILPMRRNSDGYSLPKEEIISKNCKVLIITNPVFSTGKYLVQSDVDFLKNFLDKGNYLISDESLAAPAKELLRHLGQAPGFIGVYSPHKFIHFNSFKFSCIVYNKKFEDFFDQWNDVYSGGLNITNLQAIEHYLSDNYNLILHKFYKFTDEKRSKIIDLIKNFKQFESDADCIGDFQCIYSKKLPYELSNDLKFIKDVISKTHAVFYPGCLHGFQKEHGFTFRINLVSYTNEVANSLLKIIDYLSRFEQ